MSSTEDRRRESSREFTRWNRDAAIATAAGGGAALITALGAFAVGQVGGGEARVLVEAILPTSRFLCASIMTASCTVLALMLNLLGTTFNAEIRIDKVFYLRIRQVAFYTLIVLIFATCLLVLHCVPVTKSDELPDWWYPTVYYALLALSATLGGILTSVVAMLYAALRDIIQVLGLEDEDHPMSNDCDDPDHDVPDGAEQEGG